MAILSSLRRNFTSYISPRKNDGRRHPFRIHNPLTQTDVPSSQNESLADSRHGEHEDNDLEKTPLGLDGDTLLLPTTSGRKRSSPTPTAVQSFKRRRTRPPRASVEDFADNDVDGSTFIATTPLPIKKSASDKSSADRELMPPPSARTAQHPSSQARRNSASDAGSIAISTVVKKQAAEFDDYDLERARRHAEAKRLPADAADWSEAEKDLFYHLSLRGFEPLLPRNWMMDFPTLPLSLYATDGADPLIKPSKQDEFRAIKAIRDLIDLGRHVRGKVKCNKRPEPMIWRRFMTFLRWAFSDADIILSSETTYLRTHAVVILENGRSTQDALQTLTTEMRRLASDWLQVVPANTLSSHRDSSPSLAESLELPTIHGILICSAVVMIVTKTVEGHQARYHPQIFSPDSYNSSATDKDDEAADMRMIATLDFSDSRQDVWNALALAIVVTCIRDTVVQQFKRTGLDQVAIGTADRVSFQVFPKLTRSDDPDA